MNVHSPSAVGDYNELLEVNKSSIALRDIHSNNLKKKKKKKKDDDLDLG